jgi:hypothetical protein
MKKDKILYESDGSVAFIATIAIGGTIPFDSFYFVIVYFIETVFIKPF